MSVVAACFVDVTGGSVIPAIMSHGSLNQLGAMFASQQVGVRMVFTYEAPLLWVVAAVVVLLRAGADLGWSRRMELHAGDGATDPARAWW